MPNAALAMSQAGGSLSTRDFARLARVIQDHSGIKMPPSKQSMLDGRLRKRLRATGFDSLDDYCHNLFEEDGLEDELVHLIDAVTTNKTDFFREPTHFDFIKLTILPDLAKNGRREIKAWSSACSTGAEAYTLAMVLEACWQEAHGRGYSILATDICTDVLDQALAGRFPAEMVAPVPMEMRRRHVLAHRRPGQTEVRMAPHLRSRLSVGRLNLMDERYPVDTDFDLVFCRNVLIYFDKDNQAKVLQRLCRHLRPGGHLVLGHAETVAGVDLPVTAVSNTIFRRN